MRFRKNKSNRHENDLRSRFHILWYDQYPLHGEKVIVIDKVFIIYFEAFNAAAILDRKPLYYIYCVKEIFVYGYNASIPSARMRV